MWESVDGSEWVIYYFNARAVVMVTDNFDAMQEAGMDVSAETSIECTLAFFAMPPTSSHVRGCGCRGRQTEEEVGGASAIIPRFPTLARFRKGKTTGGIYYFAGLRLKSSLLTLIPRRHRDNQRTSPVSRLWGHRT